jgi:hypothetical protein
VQVAARERREPTLSLQADRGEEMPMMRWHATAALATVVALTAAGAQALTPTQSFGTMTHDGVAMPIKGVVAVLDEKAPSIKFYLLPFVPTPAETVLIQRNDTLWMLSRTPVDAKKWPVDPQGSITLDWAFDRPAAGTLEKAWANVYAFGIGRPNSNLNFSLTAGELKGAFTGAAKAGAAVTLVTKGEGRMDAGKVTWDLNLAAKVLPVLPR